MRNRGCSHDAQTAASEANCLLEGGRGAIKLCEGKERRDARQILASQQIDAVLRGLRQRECLSPYGKKSHRRGTVDRLDYFRKQRSCKDAFGCQRFCGCDIRWTVVADRNPGCLCFYKKKGRKKAERNLFTLFYISGLVGLFRGLKGPRDTVPSRWAPAFMLQLLSQRLHLHAKCRSLPSSAEEVPFQGKK